MRRYFNWLYPPSILLLLLAICCAGGLWAVFVRGLQEHPLAYGLYALAFYTLVALCLRAVPACRLLGQQLLRWPLLRRWWQDDSFSAEVGLYGYFGFTCFYCLYKGAAAYYYRSAWFGSIAAYYLLLGIMHFLLLRQLRRRPPRRQMLASYRFCGYLLLVLTLALSAVSFHAIYRGGHIAYPGHLIYGAAAYTFGSLGFAVRDLFRYRRRDNPLYAAGKCYSLATSLVALFFLQASLLAVFGEDAAFARQMNLLTGVGVFLLIAGMADYMIISAGKEIAALDAADAA